MLAMWMFVAALQLSRLPTVAQPTPVSPLPDRMAELLTSANAGDVKSQLFLGIGAMYGDPPDLESAESWLRKAAAQDDISAITHMGFLMDIKADYKMPNPEARKWFERAADLGGVLAMIELGSDLSFAEEKAAVKLGKQWLERAAQTKNPDALYTLGNLYRTGRGKFLPADFPRALQLLKAAASAGQSSAQRSLGLWLLTRQDAQGDVAQGAKWLRQAATHDDVAAQELQRLICEPSKPCRFVEPLHESRAHLQNTGIGNGSPQLRLALLDEMGRPLALIPTQDVCGIQQWNAEPVFNNFSGDGRWQPDQTWSANDPLGLIMDPKKSNRFDMAIRIRESDKSFWAFPAFNIGFGETKSLTSSDRRKQIQIKLEPLMDPLCLQVFVVDMPAKQIAKQLARFTKFKIEGLELLSDKPATFQFSSILMNSVIGLLADISELEFTVHADHHVTFFQPAKSPAK
jgi:TPR repeat protein